MAKRFIQYFADSIRENWNLPAMSNYETKQTYAYKDVAREIAKLHILFKELNIQQNDKIALVGDNSPEWAITFLATISYGAVIVPISQYFNPADQYNIIIHSEARLLFIDESNWTRLPKENLESLDAAISLLDFHSLGDNSNHTFTHTVHRIFQMNYPSEYTSDCLMFTEKDDSSMFVLNYTSGTTGFSKGVMLSGDNFCCLFEFAIKNNLGGKGHRIATVIPMSHMYGCVNDFFFPFIYGEHITFVRSFTMIQDSRYFFQVIQDVKPNWISVVPIVVEGIYDRLILPFLKKKKVSLLLKMPFVSEKVKRDIKDKVLFVLGGSIERIFVAGAPLRKDVELFLKKIEFPISVAYGMTECSPIISVSLNNSALYSVGKPIDGVEVLIKSDESQDKAGEIYVKGRNTMLGYYKDKESTSIVKDENGWLKTGDLGVVDDEGNLFVIGRSKTMILTSSGQNIYPEDIETKINSSPFISESLVFQKDGKLVALVVLDKIQIENENIQDVENLLDQERKKINRQLAIYEYISEMKIHNDKFERTPKNSIKRHLYNY